MPVAPTLNRNGTPSAHALRKAETRRKLLAAARDLMARGESVSVASAAAHAGISVASAYRYFSEAETLRIEAGMELDMGPDGSFLTEFQQRAAGLTDVADRVVMAHRIMLDFVRRNEAKYRLYIAKGHEQLVRDQKSDRTAPRGGRRVPLLEAAAEPLRKKLGPARFTDLILSLMGCSGPEPDFVLRDIARLDNAEIDRITEQALRDIVAAHVARA